LNSGEYRQRIKEKREKPTCGVLGKRKGVFLGNLTVVACYSHSILAIKVSIIYIEASHLSNFSIHLITIFCTGCCQGNIYFAVRGMDNRVWAQDFVSDWREWWVGNPVHS